MGVNGKRLAVTYKGPPCLKSGHTERYTSNGKCRACSIEDRKMRFSMIPKKPRKPRTWDLPGVKRVRSASYYREYRAKMRASYLALKELGIEV
jgi:hypothetical protein